MFNFLCLIVDGKPEKLCPENTKLESELRQNCQKINQTGFLSGKLYILFSLKEHNLNVF